MTVFADSSALVKLYADEPGAELVRGFSLLVVSALARVEVPAALWRKSRTGELAVSDAALLCDAFTVDWAGQGWFIPVAASPALLVDAAGLVARHGLRAYDGVQLTSAAVARRADPGVDAVLCFDQDLADAAAREGFRLTAG